MCAWKSLESIEPVKMGPPTERGSISEVVGQFVGFNETGRYDGEVAAKILKEDGTTVYDPFRPTSQAVSLLQLRRKQVLATAY